MTMLQYVPNPAIKPIVLDDALLAELPPGFPRIIYPLITVYVESPAQALPARESFQVGPYHIVPTEDSLVYAIKNAADIMSSHLRGSNYSFSVVQHTVRRNSLWKFKHLTNHHYRSHYLVPQGILEDSLFKRHRTNLSIVAEEDIPAYLARWQRAPSEDIFLFDGERRFSPRVLVDEYIEETQPHVLEGSIVSKQHYIRELIKDESFASLDKVVARELRANQDKKYGAILSGETTIGYMIIGNHASAEAYMRAVLAEVEAGEIPWPLNSVDIQKRPEKNHMQGHKALVHQFKEICACYDGSVEDLIKIYASVPRLCRGYIALTARALRDSMPTWEKPVFGEAWKSLKSEKQVIALSDLNMPMLSGGYHNYLYWARLAYDSLLKKYNPFIEGQGKDWHEHLGEGTLSDFISEAKMGFMRALDRYDHTQPNLLISHARWWIRSQISRRMTKQIRASSHRNYVKMQFGKIRKELEQLYKREVTHDELLEEALKMGIPRLSALNYLDHTLSVVSLETPIGENSGDKTLGDCLFDTAPLPDEVGIRKSYPDILAEMLDNAGLTEREKFVLTRRYGLSPDSPEWRPLSEVGREMGISRERVRQIERNALISLREYAENHNIVLSFG